MNIKYQQSVRGFTLMEILLVVAITSFIAVIAIPQYLSYQERTRLSEAYSELVGINNKIKIQMFENIDNQLTDMQNGINMDNGKRLTTFIQSELSQKISQKIKEYYDVSAKRNIQRDSANEYNIWIVPKDNTYHLAIWMNELGDAYRCELTRKSDGRLDLLPLENDNPTFSNKCEKLS